MRYYYPKLNAEMPDSHDVMTLTPSEALPPLADHLTECGLSCYLDRSDAQQKLCSWGLDGTCCRRCLWGPCRVTEEKPGICGAGPALAVMANHLRMVAAAAASHGSHAKERLELILAICEGRAEGSSKAGRRFSGWQTYWISPGLTPMVNLDLSLRWPVMWLWLCMRTWARLGRVPCACSRHSLPRSGRRRGGIWASFPPRSWRIPSRPCTIPAWAPTLIGGISLGTSSG